VRGKLGLWRALHPLAATDTRIGTAVDLDALVARAESQWNRLEDARLQAAQGAFLTPPPTGEGERA